MKTSLYTILSIVIRTHTQRNTNDKKCSKCFTMSKNAVPIKTALYAIHSILICTHTKKDKRQKMQLMFDNVKKCSCLIDWAKDPTPGT